MTAAAALLARLAELPLSRPRAVLAILGGATIAALLVWPRVRFEPDVSQLLPQDHPSVRVAALLADQSRPARTMWILLRGDDLEVDTPQFAAALARSPLVAEVLWTQEQLFASGGSLPIWALDDQGIEELAAALSPAGRAAAVEALRQDLAIDPIAGRELAVLDPLGLRWLFARLGPAQQLGLATGTELVMPAAGGAALIQVRGTTDAYDAEFAAALCAHVEQTLGGRAHDAFGGYLIARADQVRVRADFERASTWSVLAIAAYLVITMRGVRLPLLVQVPAMLSIAWAVPVGFLLFGPLPTVAVAAVAVLCGLGVDFAIHYAARYRRARLDLEHEAAVRQVQRTTLPELFIDMATTAVTFLAVGAGTRGGLSAFGLLLALGLVGSFLFTVLALPVLLRFAGDRKDPERSVFAAAADRWLHRPRARTVAAAVLGVAAAVGVGVAVHGIPLSAAAESLRPPGDPVVAARQRIESEIGLATVPAVALWPLAADPAPLLRALEQRRSAGDIRFWTGLDRRATAAGQNSLAGLRRAADGLPAAMAAELRAAGLQPEPFAPAVERLAAALVADPEPPPPLCIDDGGAVRRAVTIWPAAGFDGARFAALAAQLAADTAGIAVLHGTPTVTQALEQQLQTDLRRACALALVLAAVMVGIWLRSWRLAGLALVPSSVGMVATIGLLWLLDIPLSMVSFVALPFVLGIGVDEGVHLIGHFRHGAVSTGATGVGIARTSIGTVLGFSALLLADSPGLRLLGAIVCFGSLVSMLTCLFVLAPLLASAAPVGPGGPRGRSAPPALLLVLPWLLCLGCAGFRTPQPSTLQSLQPMPLASRLVPGRFELELESPALSGTFDAIGTGSAAALRLQLFPDVGGKVLDLAWDGESLVVELPGHRQEYRGALDRGPPQLGLALGLLVAELLTPVEPGRVRGERRRRDGGLEVELQSALGAGRVVAWLQPDGRVAGYRIDCGAIGFEFTADGVLTGRHLQGLLRPLGSP